MRKEEIVVVAQLLTAIKDNIEKLEEAQRKKDAEMLETTKKKILMFQKKISEII